MSTSMKRLTRRRTNKQLTKRRRKINLRKVLAFSRLIRLDNTNKLTDLITNEERINYDTPVASIPASDE